MTDSTENNRQASVLIGPVRVSRANLEEALSELHNMVHEGGGRNFISFCEANLLVHAYKKPELAAALNRSAMTFADGIIVVLLSRLIDAAPVHRLPGPSFMLAACETGVAKGYRHFFYGGEPGVAAQLAKRLCERYPGLIVAGTYSPPFRAITASEEENIYRVIENARPDLLWVGLGGPKQLLWMDQHLHSINVPVMLGVGAAFDFHSGRVPWAPVWIRKIGMEWAFRAATGGKRIFLRNLWCVPQSMVVIFRELWRTRIAIKKT